MAPTDQSPPIRTMLTAGRVERLRRRSRREAARQPAGRAHARAARRREALDAAARARLHRRAGRQHGQSGGPAGAGRARSHLPERLSRSPPTRTSPARCIPTRALPGQLRPRGGARHQQRAPARRPDRPRRGPRRHRLVRADRRRRRGGFGGHLNVFELTKAMIAAGAAGVHFEDQLASREEVRPHGRQGAAADLVRRSATSSPRSSRPTLSGADADRRPHRRRRGRHGHLRRRRARPRVPHRRPHRGGLLPLRGGHRAGDRPRGRLRALDLDVWCETSEPDIEQAERFAKAIQTSTRASCSPTTARPRSTGSNISATTSSPSGSGPSPWPASTRSTTRCSSSPRLPRARHERLRRAAGARVRLEHDLHRRPAPEEVGAGFFEEVALAITGGEVRDGRAFRLDQGTSSRTEGAPLRRLRHLHRLAHERRPRGRRRSGCRARRWPTRGGGATSRSSRPCAPASATGSCSTSSTARRSTTCSPSSAKTSTPPARDELTLAWHRLDPWPDTVPSLTRLKEPS